MARRKRTSTADDLLELVAMLPWWAGVLLALVSYFVLQNIASQPVVAPTQAGQMGTIVTQSIWKSLATVGQYFVPFICLLGAATSAWQRRERKNLVADVARSQATNALDGMSWREFEMLVGEGFRLQGYQVVETGGGGADGGIDLVLTKPGKNGGEKFLVQCKQWRAYKVGVDVVRELYGVMAARGRHRRVCRDLRKVHGRGGRLRERAQCDAGRWPKAARGCFFKLRREPSASQLCPSEPAYSVAGAGEGSTSTISGLPVMFAKPMIRRTAKRGVQRR